MGPEGETRKTRGEIITDYMSALYLLYTMCEAKSVKPYDVWGICLKFRTKVYDLGLEIRATPKVHICLTHIPEWYMLEETCLHTLYTSNRSNGESVHGAMEIRRNRSSMR